MSRGSPFRRDDSLRTVCHWLRTCGQHLVIVGPPYSGKTYFARQLQSEPDCAAAHFCLVEDGETTEAATMVRAIGDQLVKRFPNLILPSLSTVTLLSDYPSALSHFLSLPLSSLPQPNKPLFVVVDGLQPHAYDVILELVNCLPSWLRLIVTTRPMAVTEQFRMKAFHELVLSSEDELARFISQRLPQCCPGDVIEACQDSWWFVDAFSLAVDAGLLCADRVPLSSGDLIEDLLTVLPIRLPVYLLLVKSCRRPPSRDQLLAVSQLAIQDSFHSIEKEIDEIHMVFESQDPLILSGAWREWAGDLSAYHAAWAEYYKTKRRKQPQDVVEMAYHLAHSTILPLEALRTLSSVGAGDLVLRCSVVDVPTSVLLVRAGATILDEDKTSDFVYACSTGDFDIVESAVTKCSEMELSLGLLAASARGHLAVCQLILAHRPQTSSFVSPTHWNPLRSAACNNHLPVLKLLIKHGVNVDECGHGGRTALRAAAWAGHSSIVSCLLSSGASLLRRDGDGRTPLMAAAFMDHHHVVNTLLHHGASVKETDLAGATALHLTLSNGADSEQHRETVQLLIRAGSDVEAADSHGRRSVHLAAFHGDYALPTLLRNTTHIDAQDSLGRTALMLAASQGQLEAVELLLAAGADMDGIDSHGRTSLQLAAAGGHLAVVDILLARGADEAHRDNDGAVALHYAAVHDDVSLARALASGEGWKAEDAQGQRPIAIAAQHDNTNVVRELLSLGADPSRPSSLGISAVRVAALAGHVNTLQEMASFVSDWDQRDLEGTPLLHSLLINRQTSMAELILALGATVDSTDAHSRSPAHIVCSLNDLPSARMLRRHSAPFELPDSGGRAPLLTAVWAGHALMTSFLLDTVNVDPNAADHQGASALSVAAQLGNRDLVVLLLRFGAEPSLRDHLGRTALDVARIAGHDHIRAILQTASGSADSSGFGSMPNSPMDTKSLGRKSFQKSQKLTVTSPRLARRIL